MESSKLDSSGLLNIKTSLSRDNNHLLNLVTYLEYEKDVSSIFIRLIIEKLKTLARNKSQSSFISCINPYVVFKTTLIPQKEDLKKRKIQIRFLNYLEEYEKVFNNLKQYSDSS